MPGVNAPAGKGANAKTGASADPADEAANTPAGLISTATGGRPPVWVLIFALFKIDFTIETPQ
jgi:hypothetical protein